VLTGIVDVMFNFGPGHLYKIQVVKGQKPKLVLTKFGMLIADGDFEGAAKKLLADKSDPVRRKAQAFLLTLGKLGSPKVCIPDEAAAGLCYPSRGKAFGECPKNSTTSSRMAPPSRRRPEPAGRLGHVTLESRHRALDDRQADFWARVCVRATNHIVTYGHWRSAARPGSALSAFIGSSR
jgi:hypothetical protein